GCPREQGAAGTGRVERARDDGGGAGTGDQGANRRGRGASGARCRPDAAGEPSAAVQGRRGRAPARGRGAGRASASPSSVGDGAAAPAGSAIGRQRGTDQVRRGTSRSRARTKRGGAGPG